MGGTRRRSSAARRRDRGRARETGATRGPACQPGTGRLSALGALPSPMEKRGRLLTSFSVTRAPPAFARRLVYLAAVGAAGGRARGC